MCDLDNSDSEHAENTCNKKRDCDSLEKLNSDKREKKHLRFNEIAFQQNRNIATKMNDQAPIKNAFSPIVVSSCCDNPKEVNIQKVFIDKRARVIGLSSMDQIGYSVWSDDTCKYFVFYMIGW